MISKSEKQKKKKGHPHIALIPLNWYLVCWSDFSFLGGGPDLFFGGPEIKGALSAAADTADS